MSKAYNSFVVVKGDGRESGGGGGGVVRGSPPIYTGLLQFIHKNCS